MKHLQMVFHLKLFEVSICYYSHDIRFRNWNQKGYLPRLHGRCMLESNLEFRSVAKVYACQLLLTTISLHIYYYYFNYKKNKKRKGKVFCTLGRTDILINYEMPLSSISYGHFSLEVL